MRRKHHAVLLAALWISGPWLARADAVLDWNAIMLPTLVGQNPLAETRIAAITQLAVFEAVNAVTREYQPYLGTIDAPSGALADAAAIAAAHGVLRHYVPAQEAQLDAARDASLAGIQDRPGKDAGIAVGEAAAIGMIALRVEDGTEPLEFHLPNSTAVGEWQLTPTCTPAGGVFRNLPHVTPFAIEDPRQFRSEPPPLITGDRYKKDYREVKRVGGVNSTARPQDRADVARFYAVVLAVGTWNPVASQLATVNGDSITAQARALALVNMAMFDGLIAVFDTKYRYRFWRPETAIHAGETDGNRGTRGDATFAPFIGTPCHPSYGSAHASAGYAARAVLERLYGRRGHFITLSNAAVPDITLTYSRLEQITDDIDDARIYGGIHFRFDQEAGAKQGRRVGAHVLRHQLRSCD